MINEVQFQTVQKSICTLGTKLAKDAVITTAKIPNETHHPKAFQKFALRHARKVRTLAENHNGEISEVGESLIALLDQANQKKEKQRIYSLFYECAQALTHLSENPKADKRVATILVDGERFTYGVNMAPPDVPVHGNQYAKGNRSRDAKCGCILCSERIAAAKRMGLFKNSKKFGSTLSQEMARFRQKLKSQGMKKSNIATAATQHRVGLVHQHVRQITNAVATADHNRTGLQGCIMVTTAPPCEECADTVIAIRPSLLITKKGAGKNFTRGSGIERIKEAVIPVCFVR